LIGVSGFVLAGVLAELAARVGLRKWGGYFPLVPHQRQRFELDREVLPMLEPVVHWRVNRDGERGGAVPSGAARYLVAGGSCVESYYLDQPSSIAGQLQAALAETSGGRPVHVGSVARSRISCAQIREMLGKSLGTDKARSAGAPPLEAVVLMVGASDLVRWFELGAPTEPWVDTAPLSHLFGQHPEGPFGWGLGSLALRALAARAQRRFFPREESRSRVGKRLADLRKARAAAEPKLDTIADPTLMLERFGTDLGALIDDLKSVAKTVVVARQPWFDKELTPDEERWMWNFGQGEIYAGGVQTYYSHRLVRELMRKIADRAGEVARTHGAIDLDIPSQLDPSLDNYYDFLHFTPQGAKRVAELVAHYLPSQARF
jgi:lysophospholipase L1-like esterase